MKDTLDLEQRIHQLAATVPSPTTPVEQDLARGRRRVRRTRWLVTGGAAAGAGVIALGVGLAGAATDPSGTTPSGPATQATEAPSPAPSPERDDRTGAELLQAYRDVLAEHLDPASTHLQKKPDNLQSGGGLGTKLGWTMPGQDGLGMVEIFVGGGWRGSVDARCAVPAAACRVITVDGIHATVVAWEGSTTVVVEGALRPVSITVDPLFGNNSLVPVEGMDIPVADLVRAAADERLTPPTPQQVRNAGTSMFPGLAHAEPLGEGASEVPLPPEEE